MEYIKVTVSLVLFACFLSGTFVNTAGRTVINKKEQDWGYVDVRPQAHMFWWLYKSSKQPSLSQPLVIWLQGGPGGSSCGFGNFMEIGPLDVNLNPRNTTWMSKVNILFIDNPVGTGYSYVDNIDAMTTDVHGIALDLVTVIKAFIKKHDEFKTVPLYIFSESYGGKMTVAFSLELHTAIQNKEVTCDFRGLALGDSWISPIDSVMTWGPYLYATSLVDIKGMSAVNGVANKCQHAIEKGDWKNATELWSDAESTIEELTDNVNFYNILQHNADEQNVVEKKFLEDKYLDYLYRRHVGYMDNDALSNLMNGKIKDQLGIPKNVTWGGQSGEVFSTQAEDFMKPVVDTVDQLLSSTNLSVVVYNGQLDLIVDTPGTEMWMSDLTWDGIKEFDKAKRTPLYVDGRIGDTAAFVKTYKTLSFYWILNAGHMVPIDAGDMALKMMAMITGTE
ncbi:retinoid-inducible serine carboxypeptidase-like [Saccoglossus kowalevskii]|uniref:Carboxypeptidase n=1 Tax=Saccoglossus kowalevskii TaxID=10224 RepID=A0ABM0GUR3_SACKO|nr:PREDICTED: retinoid-inducible serine carboxypeptidase-like [Saccoglossus kowalevskii]